jgi:hypothetical protein
LFLTEVRRERRHQADQVLDRLAQQGRLHSGIVLVLAQRVHKLHLREIDVLNWKRSASWVTARMA